MRVSIPSTIIPTRSLRSPSRSRPFMASHFRRGRRAIVEVRQRHARDRFPEGSLDAAEVSFVLRRHKRDCLAGRFHPRRPPDAVHIVGRDRRHVVVDHVGDALDVNPARRDVRGDQDLVPSAPESGEGGLSLALAAVTVDPRDVEARSADLTGHAVRASLRAHEDEDGHHVLPAEETDEERRLEVLWDRIDLMANRRRGPVRRGHGDADGIAHDRPRERLDLRSHRRGEEEGLSLPWEGVDNPPDIREETHVEHPIRLVEDKDLEPAEVDVAAGHMIEETAWRRDDDVDARTQGVFLRGHSDAAIDRVAVDSGALRKPAEGDLDLGRELSRRRQDEGPRAARGLFHESLKDRQQEGGRLAGARLRRPDDVATGEDRRDCLLLDWRRGLVSEAVYRPDENRVKAELVKGALRVRDLHRGSYGFIGLRVPTDGRGRGKTYLTSSPFPGSAVSRGVGSMKGERSRREWTGPEYRIRVSFGVPLDFAFAWCTDYTPEDASLEGESYQRKIIAYPGPRHLRGSRRIRRRMELVAGRRHVEPSEQMAYGRDRQPPRRHGRLRLVAAPGRADPVRPSMEPTAQSPGGEEAHEGGAGSLYDARVEAVRRRDGTGLPAVATPTDEVNARPERGSQSPRRCRRRPPGHAAVIVPKSPSDSSFGPAVKNSVSTGPLLTVPCPNRNAQSPSMTSFRPSVVRSAPMSSNVPSGVSWYAFTWPSPKLPMSRSPPNRPKLAGASARPHGAFNRPCCATRTSRFPSVSNASTKPRPWPSISSFAPAPCFANVTKIRVPIVWIPNGA